MTDSRRFDTSLASNVGFLRFERRLPDTADKPVHRIRRDLIGLPRYLDAADHILKGAQLHRETIHVQEFDRLFGCACYRKLSQNLTENAGELEAVAGEAGGERDLGVSGVTVDDEMFVG